MQNNPKLVYTVIELLRKSGINTVLFGGWAEELSGSIEPRSHGDIDLLYFSDNFNTVDRFLKKNTQIIEIFEKHYYHKRAFLVNGIMVELFLIQKKDGKNFTNFWDLFILNWPPFRFHSKWLFKTGFIKIVDPQIIEFYRSQNHLISSARTLANTHRYEKSE